MAVASKGFRVEGNHLYHSILTWVRISPEAAFAYVADIGRHNEWTTNRITITPLTPGPVRLGSKYTAVGRQWGKDWPSDLEVTGYEPPRRFEFTATGGPVGTPEGDPHRHEFLFTAESGGTRLEARRWDPIPPSWPAWQTRVFLVAVAPILNMPIRLRTIENLRRRLELAESGQAGPKGF